MSALDTPGEGASTLTLPDGDPVAVELTLAIHGGDLDTLRRLLGERPELAIIRMIGRKGLEGGWRTPLHAATDWPGQQHSSVMAGPSVSRVVDLDPPRSVRIRPDQRGLALSAAVMGCTRVASRGGVAMPGLGDRRVGGIGYMDVCRPGGRSGRDL